MKFSLHASKANYVLEIICRDFILSCECLVTYK